MKKNAILVILLIAAMIGIKIYHYFQEEKESHRLVLYGNVDVRLVDIAFRVPGQVDKVLFEEGDFVTSGTLLSTLDKNPYNSQVSQAAANIDAIKANLANAEQLLKRRETLIGTKGVSQEDVDNAIATKDNLQGSLKASEAALKIAEDNLRFTEAFSPSDGFILTRIREPGSVVKASDPIYTVSISSPVWVRAYISEPELGRIYNGMTAEIHTDLKGGKVYQGTIGFISPMAEFTPKTVETTQLRTDLVYRLRIYVDNPDHVLKQGMPVTVIIDLQKGSTSKG